MKIQSKFLIIALTIIVVTAILVLVITRFVSINIVKQEIGNHLITTTQSRAGNIEMFLKSLKESTNQLSKSIIIEKFLSANKWERGYKEKFNDVMTRLKYSKIIFKDAYDVFVLNKNGIVVASSNKNDIGKYKSKETYFVGAKHELFIKDAYFSPTIKKNCITFSVPVLDKKNGNFLGVVVIRFSKGILDKITVNRTGLGETGETYLINKDGYMITPSRFKNDTFLKQKVNTQEANLCFKIHKNTKNPMLMGEKPSLYLNYIGNKVLGTYYYFPEMKWCLLVEISAKEVYRPVTLLTNLIMIIFLILLSIWIITIVITSKTITSPIVKLYRGTEEIIRGNLDYKVGTKGKDEIGQLSRAFDKMAQSLKISNKKLEEHRRNLEKKVENRTAELKKQFEKSEYQRVATLNILQDLDESNLNLKREIEERKKAKQALQESEERLRALINATPDIICFKDGKGRWLEANKSIIQLFNLEKVNYPGKTDAELADINDFFRDAFLSCANSDKKAWEKGKISRGEKRIPLLDGNSKVYDVIKVPLFYPDNKRKGLVALGRDITEREKAETQLKTSLKEKIVLLKEIHHRVKNNMQIIVSLLRLQSRHIKNKQVIDILKESQNRIKSMALVHEKLYQSKNLASIDFAEYIRGLTIHLFSSYRVNPDIIKLKLNIKNVFLNVNKAIPCSLLINDLISNSLEHAFPNGKKGEIHINLDKYKKDKYELIISDTGVGFPKDLDFRNTESLGLQLVCSLAQQLGGTIELDRNKGTTFRIVFGQ